MSKIHQTQSKYIFICEIVVLCVLAVIFPRLSSAATLFINPSSSSVSSGNIVSLKVLVNTEGKAINNADSVIQFPTELLEVVSVNKGSSIFSLWVEEPKFSNLDGKITFNGGAPNPGFTGGAGEIVSVVFRAKKAGSATIVFTDSAVRQNDGLGTNILTSKSSATILVANEPVINTPLVQVTSQNLAPARPIVISSTHPKQDTWYTTTSATFSWNIPNDITSIQTLLNKSPNTVPTIPYDSSVSQRTVNGISDGISYFHIRYMNSVGWGPVAHYTIRIDNTPPQKFSPGVAIVDARNVVTLNAVDETSGIDYYSLSIDNNTPIVVKKNDIADGAYLLPVQKPGEHRMLVTAYDKAGNSTESSVFFVSPEIIAPELTINQNQLTKGEKIIITGTSQYPKTNVLVNIELHNKKVLTYNAITDETGIFNIESEKLEVSGRAKVSALLLFENNVQSPSSRVLNVDILDTLIVKTSKSAIYTLSFVIPALLLVIAMLFMLYLGWHKFFGLRRKMQEEIQATSNEIHEALLLFRDELGNQLLKLEKIKEDRELNRKEKKIFQQLQLNIDNIDEFIVKKLRKIK